MTAAGGSDAAAREGLPAVVFNNRKDMSLQTDIVFVKALRSNATLIQQLPAGDVYNTTIALPDEEAANAPLPYVIVSFDGLNNQDTTKDSSYEGLTDTVTIGIEIAAETRPQLAALAIMVDTVTIGIEIAAETRPQLAALAIMVRQTIAAYFAEHVQDVQDEDYALIPNAYTTSAQGVQYDSLKPCFWQILSYQCDTNPDE